MEIKFVGCNIIPAIILVFLKVPSIDNCSHLIDEAVFSDDLDIFYSNSATAVFGKLWWMPSGPNDLLTFNFPSSSISHTHKDI